MSRKVVPAVLIYALTLLALIVLAIGAFAWVTCPDPDPEAGNSQVTITPTQSR